MEIVEERCGFGITRLGHEDRFGHVKSEKVFIDAIDESVHQRFEQRDLYNIDRKLTG